MVVCHHRHHHLREQRDYIRHGAWTTFIYLSTCILNTSPSRKDDRVLELPRTLEFTNMKTLWGFIFFSKFHELKAKTNKQKSTTPSFFNMVRLPCTGIHIAPYPRGQISTVAPPSIFLRNTDCPLVGQTWTLAEECIHIKQSFAEQKQSFARAQVSW